MIAEKNYIRKPAEMSRIRENSIQISRLGYEEARRFKLNHETSEDIGQEVFIKVLKNAHLYDEKKASLQTWIKAIARNTIKDYLRRNKKRSQTRTLRPDFDEPIDGSKRFHPENNKRKKVIWKYLNYLPQEQQEILHFIYGKDYTISQTAQYFKMPQGTVKSKLNRALEGLRGIIPKNLEEQLMS